MTGFPAGLDEWLCQPLGKALLQAESTLLAEQLEDVFGMELLQLGAWGPPRQLLAGARTRGQRLMDPSAAGVDIQGRLTELPLATGAVDAVLLPHTLEVAADPQAALREADRVLGAEGKLLVLGFRPLSPWGLRSGLTKGGYPPGLQRLLSPGRLRDWLLLLGYEIISVRPYLYRWPRGRGRPDALVPGMLRRGLANPWPAGAYLLKARKRVYTLTPIRPRRMELSRRLIGQIAEPSI
jgi:SAM-dependent methyltransferase